MNDAPTRYVSPDDGIVQSFKRGAWTAHVIDRNHPNRPGNSDYMVRLDDPNGFNTSWPMQYEKDGEIVYEFEPSQDAKRATKAAFRWINGE